MADLADLERKQADAAKLAQRMVKEKDPQQLLEMAKQLKERTDELQKMAKGIEKAMTPQMAGGGETVVVLTPAQRARITEQTGVGVETVTLTDTADRVWAKAMPTMEPRIIEKEAAKVAAAHRLESETRGQVEKIVKQLEKLDVPELQETIEQLRKDPTLGQKKKK